MPESGIGSKLMIWFGDLFIGLLRAIFFCASAGGFDLPAEDTPLKAQMVRAVPAETVRSAGIFLNFIIIFITIALYCLYIYFLFQIFFIFLPIGSAAIVCVILYNYLKTAWVKLCIVEGLMDRLNDENEALPQDYFRKAYQDYQHVVKESWKLNRTTADWTIKSGTKFFTNRAMFFTWPLGITFFIIAIVGSLTGIVVYAVFSLVHLTLVVIRRYKK